MLAGIDLGGTQVRVALARSDGKLITSVKTKTPMLKTPQGLVDWAAAEIERLRGNQKVTSIAIGAPGPIDIKRGILVNPPNLPWKNVPLTAMLSRATGAKVHLTNAIDPEMFVMGGGVTRSWKLVAPTMVGTLRSSPFIKPARRPLVRRARLGDRAGQVGAVEWARINQ